MKEKMSLKPERTLCLGIRGNKNRRNLFPATRAVRIMVALLLTIITYIVVPYAAMALETGSDSGSQDSSGSGRKVVRVGWYDSSYNTLDQYGRRSGYAYEYQLKLSAYNGWTYE